jgi:transposase
MSGPDEKMDCRAGGFTEAFVDEAVERAETDGVAKAAQNLGISKKWLERWVRRRLEKRVVAYAFEHGTSEAADKFGIEKGLVRRLLGRHGRRLRVAQEKERMRRSLKVAAHQREIQREKAKRPTNVLDPATVRAPNGDIRWATRSRTKA